MKVTFLILLLLCTAFAKAQETAAYADTVYSISDAVTADKVVYKEVTPTAAQKPEYTSRTFNDGYKENYKSNDFNYTVQPAGKSMFRRFLEWLSRLLNGDFIRNKKGEMTGAGIIWYTLTVAIILVVAYLIAWAIMGKEGKWIFGRGRKNFNVFDVADENIHEMDFTTLIAQTQKEGNYRLAVRYYYLWLLKKLSVREVISWHTDKTNSDYYYEIKDTALRDDFKYLSYVYDHSWYGEFPIDNVAFAKAEKAFQKTLNKL